jgi:glutamate formiminotransferase/formiminotetrahydrofolate cyclodeaminase
VADRIPYAQYALIDLLDAFASNEPLPAGGSASALAGSVAVSLLVMVAGLPKTRTGTPEEAADLAAASARLRPLRDRLLELVDDDSEAYRSLLDAFKLPKGSDAERRARVEAIAAGMRAATEAPLDIMRVAQQALAGAVVVARNGHVPAAADVAVAVELLSAAVRGCGMGVDVNLAHADPSYATRIKVERDQLEADALADAARALELVRG